MTETPEEEGVEVESGDPAIPDEEQIPEDQTRPGERAEDADDE